MIPDYKGFFMKEFTNNQIFMIDFSLCFSWGGGGQFSDAAHFQGRDNNVTPPRNGPNFGMLT
jgi:hypothetical protein